MKGDSYTPKKRRPPIRIGRETRGLTWLWGVPYKGVQIAWSQKRWWFIGWTTRAYKERGW